MRNFSYTSLYPSLLTPEIVSLVSLIHEFKGQQTLYLETKEETLSDLLEIAKIQSTEASNRIEGIVTTEDRLGKIIRDKTMPKNRSEQEIAGYRDVLATIYDSYEFIPLQTNIILQLHRDLYKFRGVSFGGSFKNSDNVISEVHPDGTSYVRFQPIHAWETADAIECLCKEYNDVANKQELDMLFLIPVFILDFLCIHPFNDGNGRMSRLLTLLLLYREGYFVGKYISIEKLIADSKETYYETLQASSDEWHVGNNDYIPFVRYMLGIILAAYREFSSRAKLLTDKDISKPDRVRKIVRNHFGKITIAEIVKQCPDISKITIQRALKEMLDREEIIKIGDGRYTAYTWNREKD